MLLPFNFSTLSTRAYGCATEELLEEDPLWRLTIVTVESFPVLSLEPQAEINFWLALESNLTMIECRNLGKSYGTVQAVSEISLSLNEH